MEKITNLLYKKEDEPLLNFLVEEVQSIEPEWYLPILPMVLINGSHGIGTGFSSHVPCFNPKDIIKNIKLLMDEKKVHKLTPYYRNFKGKIVEKDVNGVKKWVSQGVWKFKNSNTLEITELPIGIWTDNYHQHLENLIIDNTEKDSRKKKKQCITNYKKCNDHDDEKVHLLISFKRDCVDKYRNDIDKLVNTFKLEESKSCSVSNLHLYDPLGEIVKFNSPESILRSYYKIRLPFYKKRQEYQIKFLEREIRYLTTKIRFVKGIIEENVKVSKKSNDKILEELKDIHKFQIHQKIL